MDELREARLARLKQEIARLAVDYCLEANVEAFSLPIGIDQLYIAFGTREQIAKRVDHNALQSH